MEKPIRAVMKINSSVIRSRALQRLGAYFCLRLFAQEVQYKSF